MIPLVTRQKLEEALSEFDLNLRSSPEFENWEQNKAQNWALEHQTKKYPPKKIISIATGLPVNGFSGGKESNDYLATLGFTVNKLRELSLRETLILIITRYPTISKTEAFGGGCGPCEGAAEAAKVFISITAGCEFAAHKRPHGKGASSYRSTIASSIISASSVAPRGAVPSGKPAVF